MNNVLPFWNRAILDGAGGYRLNHDAQGRWRGRSAKSLVTQARTIWFFARLLRSPYAMEQHAELARHGFAFLEQRLHDAEHGGFYWETDTECRAPTNDSKLLYGQAFALYALSEYADALRDTRALQLARELFEVIDRNAHDRVYGGYVERFDRTWHVQSPPVKTLNTHIHLLEAITRYYEMSADVTARERILELMLILSNEVVRKNIGACSNAHRLDWNPILTRAQAFVSYGHDLENGWLLIRACEAIGMESHAFVDLFRTLANYSLRHGFDRRHGGFYHTGRFNRHAGDRNKVWWVQAEALLALRKLWSITGEECYESAFLRTLDWIYERQADWAHGEWHARVDANGRPSNADKAGPWKGPYHTGRALLECLDA